MSEKKSISEIKQQINPSTSSNEVKTFINFAKNDLSSQIIHRQNCKVCNSKFRKESEDMYIKTGNAKSCFNHLIALGDKNISYDSVKNHMKHHVPKSSLNERIQEYAEDLELWSKIKQSRTTTIKEHITMLNRKLFIIESSVDEGDIEANRKSAETCCKVIEQISKLEEKLEKNEKDMDPIRTILNTFKDVVEKRLQTVVSIEAKQAITDILDDFGKEIAKIEGLNDA